MTIEELKAIVAKLVDEYDIKSVLLFGSRATGTNNPDSDIDLIVEFNSPITLITLSSLKNRLEELTGYSVDIIHGPIQEDDMIVVDKAVELYAA